MPIVVTIYISSPSSILTSYDVIKVYRSDYSDGYFSEVTTAVTRISISSSQYYYNYEDSTGTSSSYYKVSYYNSSTLIESSLSSASKGTEVEDTFVNSSYPAEISFTPDDSLNINRIRYYIGDRKSVKRDYVSPSCTGAYEQVSGDGYSYALSDRGWPLRVIKDSVEYTTKTNPFVTDYSFITFSGTTVSTTSGVLDVWYERFRHSDREILGVYNTTPAPAYVATSSTTTEMYRLSASITILEEEIRQLTGETSGSVSLQGEFSYNPEPLLRQKRVEVDKLKAKLEDLVAEYKETTLEGVRIE